MDCANNATFGCGMEKEIALAQLERMTEGSGLKLTLEELQKLLPGVRRSQHQISELREIITDTIEPATTFFASLTEKR